MNSKFHMGVCMMWVFNIFLLIKWQQGLKNNLLKCTHLEKNSQKRKLISMCVIFKDITDDKDQR